MLLYTNNYGSQFKTMTFMKMTKNQALINPALNRRLAAYSIAAGAACTLTSAAQASGILYDNGGAGWTATLANPTGEEYYMNIGLGGVVNLANSAGVISTNGAALTLGHYSSAQWKIDGGTTFIVTSGSMPYVSSTDSSTAPTSVSASNISGYTDILSDGGPYYLDVNLPGSDGNHYGWVELTTSGDTMTLDGFAYNTTPNQSFTGVVPEPTTTSLAVVALLATGLNGLRRHRQMKRPTPVN
jgi:hypothetical protein